MALHVTQCPSCDSSFNTSARMLQAAHGLVRCGACLSVFEAAENFITPGQPHGSGNVADGSRESVFISGQEDFLDVARFIRTATGLNDQLSEPALEEPVQVPQEEWTPEAASEPALESLVNSTPLAVQQPEPEAEAYTEPTAEPFVAAEPVGDAEAFSQSFTALEPEPQPLDEFFAAPEAEPKPEPQIKATPFEVAEIHAGTQLPRQEFAQPVRHSEAPSVVDTTPVPDIKREETKEVLRARVRKVILDEPFTPLDSLSDDDLAAIHDMPDTLELEQRIPENNWPRTIGYGLLSLTLLLTLSGQFLWQRYELLSLHPDLRPIYQLACNFLGCSIPPVEDLANIQIENLVVRSHPEIRDALIVSAVLRNMADFQQPFPILRLQFRDPDLLPVAGRDFQPQEYLPPTLQSIINIPVNTPVQFTLELVDPGADAVNYELVFISRYL